MSRSLIGIDINNSSVSILILQQRLRDLVWKHHELVPAIDAGGITAMLQAALLRSREAGADCSGACNLALPADWFIFRSALLPFTRSTKIRQVLPYTLEPGLPLPLDQLLLDYTPAAAVGGQQAILAAAVETSQVQAILDQLAEVNLFPACITISGMTAARWAAATHKEAGRFLFLDTGRRHGTLFLFIDGRLHLLRSLNAGQALEAQVQHTLNTFNAAGAPGFTPQKCCVSGPGNIDIDALAIQLGASTDRCITPGGLRFAEADPARPPRLIPELTSVLCLTLAASQGIPDFNFSTRRSLVQKTWQNHRPQLVFGIVLVALATILSLVGLFVEIRQLDHTARRLQQDATHLFQQTFPHETTVVDPLQQMHINLREARRQAHPLPAAPGWAVIDLLFYFSRAIPGELDLELQRISGGDDLVMITGETTTFNAVEAIKNTLEQIEAVQSVTITSATADKSGNRINFRLRLQMEEELTGRPFLK